MLNSTHTSPKWAMAFELNILRRLEFDSVAIPFSPESAIAAYLRRMNVRVAANDIFRSNEARCTAKVGNFDHSLSNDDIDVILDDVYVPGYRLQNAALSNWFSETDAWWFDNIRRNIDKLNSPGAQAIAAMLAIEVGNYVLSFNEETRQLRQPLSVVYRRFWSMEPDKRIGFADSQITNTTAEEMVSNVKTIERYSDLLFLRLPEPHVNSMRDFAGRGTWAEEWIRGEDTFWDGLESSMSGRFGGPTATRSQYLSMLDQLLGRASNMKKWAISMMEYGSLTSQDIVDVVMEHRRVDSVFTKDLSELTGTKAIMITA
ncbi:MAG: hypothetical protein JNL64_01990 [Blastocatellia bacterium]|nr:hypothetical protein [Blastocatellia bacterium]